MHLHKPHTQYVSGLHWSRRAPSLLHTSSYDGTVKTLHAAHAAWECLYHSETHEFSAFTPAADAVNTLWLGTNAGEVGAVDPRASALACPMRPAHSKKVISN